MVDALASYTGTVMRCPPGRASAPDVKELAERSYSASAVTPGRCPTRRCSSGCGVGGGDEGRCGCGASYVGGCCDEEGYRVHFEPIDCLIASANAGEAPRGRYWSHWGSNHPALTEVSYDRG